MFEDASLLRHEFRINTQVALLEQHSRLEEKLSDLIRAEPAPKARRVASGSETNPELTALADQIEALEAAMEGSWVTLTLEQQPGPVWREFKADNPPRDGLPDDQRAGVNIDAVLKDLLPKCVVEPAMTEADWDRAINHNGIWPGDQARLAYTLVGMHQVTFDIPKSQLVSAVRESFDAQREQLASSASLSDDSADGSRPSATSTSRLTGP
jgi:hypothetical protein